MRLGADLVHALAISQPDYPGGHAAVRGRQGASYIPESRARIGSFAYLMSTFAHEIGHNLSLWHDRATVYEGSGDRPPEATTHCPHYPYGYGFRRQPIPGSQLLCSSDGDDWRTLMSYGGHLDRHECPSGYHGNARRLMRYSNPNKTYQGSIMGAHGDACVTGWPRGPVDAVRAVDKEARRAAAYGNFEYPAFGGGGGSTRMGDGTSPRAESTVHDLSPLLYGEAPPHTTTQVRVSSDNDCIHANLVIDDAPSGDLGHCAVDAPHSQCRLLVENVCRTFQRGIVSVACLNRTAWDSPDRRNGRGLGCLAPPVDVDVRLGGAQTPLLSFDAPRADVQEGGVARLPVTLSRPATQQIVAQWKAQPDVDGNTANANQQDFVGALQGSLQIAVGDTTSAVEIRVRDDADVESPREFYSVSIGDPPFGSAWAVGRGEASIVIQEGVCDRPAAVRNALRGNRQCWRPTADDLARRTHLDLSGRGVTSLSPSSFMGLSSLRSLHLQGNALEALPADLLAGLPSLETLNLSRNRIAELPSAAFLGAPRLTNLNLSHNQLTDTLLSFAVFQGVSRLTELDLTHNPASPFLLVFLLYRNDQQDAFLPGSAPISAAVIQSAPFPIASRLAADRASGVPANARVTAGEWRGTTFTARQSTPNVGARITMLDQPSIPDTMCGAAPNKRPCFRGMIAVAIPEIYLFKAAPVVDAEPPDIDMEANGDRSAIPLSAIFSPHESGASDALTYTVSVDKPELLQAFIRDGEVVLIANPEGREGVAVVTIGASAPGGPQNYVSFAVGVHFVSGRFPPVWLLPWVQENKAHNP